MRRKIIVITISLLALLTVVTACQSDSKEANELSAQDTAELFLNNLADGKYEAAYGQLDTDMKDAIEVGDLEDVWTVLEESSGEHIEFEYERTDTDEPYEVIFIKSIFTKEDITFMVTINKELEVAGFFVI